MILYSLMADAAENESRSLSKHILCVTNVWLMVHGIHGIHWEISLTGIKE